VLCDYYWFRGGIAYDSGIYGACFPHRSTLRHPTSPPIAHAKGEADMGRILITVCSSQGPSGRQAKEPRPPDPARQPPARLRAQPPRGPPAPPFPRRAARQPLLRPPPRHRAADPEGWTADTAHQSARQPHWESGDELRPQVVLLPPRLYRSKGNLLRLANSTQRNGGVGARGKPILLVNVCDVLVRQPLLGFLQGGILPCKLGGGGGALGLVTLA